MKQHDSQCTGQANQVPVVIGQDPLALLSVLPIPSSIALRDPDREYKLLQRAVCHVPSRDANPKTRLHGVWIIREDHKRSVQCEPETRRTFARVWRAAVG